MLPLLLVGGAFHPLVVRSCNCRCRSRADNRRWSGGGESVGYKKKKKKKEEKKKKRCRGINSSAYEEGAAPVAPLVLVGEIGRCWRALCWALQEASYSKYHPLV